MRFAGSIFLSAFLLFQVQLILAKYLLPWFGGAPAVWTTCILFFQSFLLLGYAYAFLIDRKLGTVGQARLHRVLLVLALCWLALSWWSWGSPILPAGAQWKPEAGSGHPITGVLLTLLVAVGLPYTLLAANSPLVQRWYALGRPGKVPYRLYAISNVGSLLALLSYPFLVEPYVPLRLQSWIWGGAYVAFVLATLACATGSGSPAREAVEPARSAEPAGRTAGPFQRVAWLILAACPSSMLLAITNDLSQEVAVTPFVWVLPLAIYLLSFIICFDHTRWYSRRLFVLLTYLTSMGVLITTLKGFQLGMLTHLVSYSSFLFCFCMLCHGELYRMRPGREQLTSFFLTVATGGVAGGLVVGILAPLFFRGYWEFHIAILGSWVLLTAIFWRDKASFLNRGDRWHFLALLFLVLYILLHYGLAWSGGYGLPFIRENRELSNLLLAALIALVIFLPLRRRGFVREAIWPRILIGMVIFIAECFAVYRIRSTGARALAADRNFFGVVKVTEETAHVLEPYRIRRLIHGKILHGFQFLREDLELVPTSYYARSSGIGIAFGLEQSLRRGAPLRVGVTGLGAGAITAHLREGDFLRFYEINPLVVDYAYGEDAFFTYLSKSPATVDVKLGDARLVLEEELAREGSHKYDLLVLDAFSSDSVPIHLLTREAFQTYFAHLRDKQSIIAVNITNRIVDLRAPVLTIAREMGAQAVVVRDGGALPIPSGSEWILLCRDPAVLDQPFLQSRAVTDPGLPEILWTDDFSNLWKVLRRRD